MSSTNGLTYAGIGSRNTPNPILYQMSQLAQELADRGWHLHSGGATGADEAFASGAPVDKRTIWLPWQNYNGQSGPDCRMLTAAEMKDCMDVAGTLHPAWNKCTIAARKLHGRNVAIMGMSVDKLVDMVLCYTPKGQTTGGTGMGIRIANHYNIPVFNFGNMSLDEIKASIEYLEEYND